MASSLSTIQRWNQWPLKFAVMAWLLFLSPLQADPPSPAEPWQRAIGAWSWVFPRDHGAHPNFKTEWWYFTGNLRDARQRPFGYQLTLFRQGIQFTPAQRTSRWAVRDLYFGHFTISDLAPGSVDDPAGRERADSPRGA
jgi:predicted secreted hydrolase